ncbi:hypothetical protein [Burkholderia cenocepacia]|uniref:hypothetical protein n=1 Tax=Burkholderia cenocepacia TaxID=95486 RepID=UPI002B2550EA|nr:hypothetical protein [Burkholderia cenocepacia]MEB2500693.1 hypothetical protein [Burkholderia cenocepacia]MEB2558185.1 hypothetical protein [Burkholderia cenocepacia]
MKPAKGVDDLASRLRTASEAPLVHPPVNEPPGGRSPAAPAQGLPVSTDAREQVPAAKKVAKRAGAKEVIDTMALTLRPTRTLHARYVAAAAKRSQELGRMVSAQEIMLEVLEKGKV